MLKLLSVLILLLAISVASTAQVKITIDANSVKNPVPPYL